MARAYSLDLRERVVAAVDGGPVLPFGGQDVHGQRRQRCEVVAAPARRRQSGGAEDGRPPALPCGARARLGSGADRREAGPHAARSCSGSWPTAAWWSAIMRFGIFCSMKA